MAFFRGPQSPREEQFPANPLSPPQRNPNRWSASMVTPNDVRGGLHRRFTTSTVPTLSPIGQQRRQAAGDLFQPSSTQNRLTPGERAARHYESLLQAQRKIQEELEKVDAETRREVDENIRHEQSVTQLFAQSEPTTPPEYHAGFPNSFSKPSRYSTASITSPPGILSRPNRASTNLTSPSTGYSRHYVTNSSSALPSQSVPGSRRQSDDEDDENNFMYNLDANRRTVAKSNRNSMPISPYDRKRNNTDLALGPINTTSFLFEGDDKLASLATKSNQTSPPDTKTYLQVQHTADGFPKLIRREDNGDISLSAVSAALDLAFSSEPDQHLPEQQSGRRHRISLPPNGLSSNGSVNIAPLNGILANANDNRPKTSARHSMEVKFTAETKRPTLLTSPSRANGHNGTQSSYSTNDLPTLKSINGDVKLFSPKQSVKLADPTSPDQNINNMTRRSSGSARQSQDLSANQQKSDDMHNTFNQPQSGLHANAPTFGPHPHENGMTATLTNSNMQPYGAFYNGYAMQMMHNGFNNVNLNGNGVYGPQAHWQNQLNGAHQPAAYGAFQQFPQGSQAVQGVGRYERGIVPQRRQVPEEMQARFNTVNIEDLVGEIYALCKDQHGCRYLQRKLEERNEQTVQIIFDEVKTHMKDLMIDPFGNYLCQKLLESASKDQRTVLIRDAANDMTKIALNQHGTRALQKMIEYITEDDQTVLIIEALGNDVVVLIQDLNGNHVIQKLLNHLSSKNAQFIFDAVGANCVTVGTHRHGCCVLQRCIDHADGIQKGQMVDHVIANAHALVQDPFGNYVIQYILDLNEPTFTEPLCRSFLDDILPLSRQKFSSNVIEKCIRCCSQRTKNDFINIILQEGMLARLLRDGFANYVVQTAMDFAEGDLKRQLIDQIRGHLQDIRNTPHGRRIASKIGEYDSRIAVSGNEVLTSLESSSIPHAQPPPAGQAAPPAPIAPVPVVAVNAQNFPVPQANAPPAFVFQAPAVSQPFTTASQAFGLNATAAPPQFGAHTNGATRNNRHGIVGPPSQWSPSNDAGFEYAIFGNGNGHSNDNIHSPIPQRSSQSYGTLFNGGQTFPNGNYGAQSYGQF